MKAFSTFVSIIVLVFPTQVFSQELFKIIYGPPECNASVYADFKVPFPRAHTAYAIVPEWRRLADPQFRTTVLEAVFKSNLDYCKQRNIPAGSAVVLLYKDTNNLLIRAWLAAVERNNWHVNFDQLQKVIAETDAEELRMSQIRERQIVAETARRDNAQREQEQATAQRQQMSYRRILVTDGVRRQRFELAI